MEKFWMVKAENSDFTRVQHGSLESARNEADRLASANPGTRFFVLEASGFCRVDRPSSWTELMELPF